MTPWLLWSTAHVDGKMGQIRDLLSTPYWRVAPKYEVLNHSVQIWLDKIEEPCVCICESSGVCAMRNAILQIWAGAIPHFAALLIICRPRNSNQGYTDC